MVIDQKVLVARHSAFQLIVLTEDAAGMRTLRFGHDGVCQSVVKPGEPTRLELPYANVLLLCLAFVEAPRRALVVGLGAGTIPSLLYSLLPDLAIDVVEIDKEVLEVAKTHCGFVETPRMRVFISDGRDFVESCQDPYDLIILDTFDAESIPAHLATLEFLRATRRALTTAGIAVANIWGRSSNRFYEHMLLTYQEAFPQIYVLDVPAPGTKVFIALPTPQEISRETLVDRAKQLSRDFRLPYDLSGFLNGFRNSRAEHLRGGHVLRD